MCVIDNNDVNTGAYQDDDRQLEQMRFKVDLYTK